MHINIQAVDDDAGENGTIIYFIHSGNDDNYFILDQNTGTLSINKKIPYTAIGEHILKIEARDCGQPYHFTITDFIIEIDDSTSKAYLSMNYYHLNNADEFSSFGSSGYKLNFYIVIAIITSACIISTILICSVFIILRRSKRNNVSHDRSNKIDNNTLIHSIPDCLSQFPNIEGQTSLELTNYPNGKLLSSPHQDSMFSKCSNKNISTEYWDYNDYNNDNNHMDINTNNMNRHNDLMDNQKIEIYIPSCQYMKMMDLTDETDLKYSYDAHSNYFDETQQKFSLKAYQNDGIIQ
ncbi:unnamed protein product [Schistosoma mattheei]|uniref:Uncharacterized protein n=1 Tax=Schistosoma mattheei TaxID=31246 RepID=A0A183P1D0_9TREM|nr:unnamed protein product [Schistosoma mattheei]